MILTLLIAVAVVGVCDYLFNNIAVQLNHLYIAVLMDSMTAYRYFYRTPGKIVLVLEKRKTR